MKWGVTARDGVQRQAPITKTAWRLLRFHSNKYHYHPTKHMGPEEDVHSGKLSTNFKYIKEIEHFALIKFTLKCTGQSIFKWFGILHYNERDFASLYFCIQQLIHTTCKLVAWKICTSMSSDAGNPLTLNETFTSLPIKA